MTPLHLLKALLNQAWRWNFRFCKMLVKRDNIFIILRNWKNLLFASPFYNEDTNATKK